MRFNRFRDEIGIRSWRAAVSMRLESVSDRQYDLHSYEYSQWTCFEAHRSYIVPRLS